MKPCSITSSVFKGVITLPPSKSHTMRALLLSSLGNGISHIQRPLLSPDTDAMLQAISAFNASVEQTAEGFKIQGVGSVPKRLNRATVDAGNSGQVLRFASAFYAQSHSPITVTGDHSVQTLRPCTQLIFALRTLGAQISATAAPFLIKGPISPGHCKLSGEDSQPVSALLLSLPLLNGSSHIDVSDLGERPWIDLTLDWMKRLGLRYEETGTGFFIPGNDHISAFQRVIPGDLSALAFPLILGLITPSQITIRGVDLSDVQGDKAILDVVTRMGARYDYNPETFELTVEGPQRLQGIDIDVNSMIDALPALTVLACYAEGITRLLNSAVARVKESDRLKAMATELNKMGGKVTELPDGLIIEGVGTLFPDHISTHNDHRIALALSCAAFASTGTSNLDDISSIAKSFPNFFEQLKAIAI